MILNRLAHKLQIYRPLRSERLICPACQSIYCLSLDGDPYYEGFYVIYSRFGNLAFSVRAMGNPATAGCTELREIIIEKPFHAINTAMYLGDHLVCPYCENSLQRQKALQPGLQPYQYAIYARTDENDVFKTESESFGNLIIATEYLRVDALAKARQYADPAILVDERFSRFPYELRFAYRQKLMKITCMADEHLGKRRDEEGNPILIPHGCPSTFFVIQPPEGEGLFFYSRFGNMVCAVEDEVYLDPDAMRELEYLQFVSPYLFKFIDPPDRDDFKCPLCGHLIPEANKTILEEKSVAPYLALSPRA